MDFNKMEIIAIVLIFAAVLVIGFNSFQLGQLKNIQTNPTARTIANVQPQAQANNAQKSESAIDIIPKGVPNIYGKELGVSYGDVSASDLQKADATIAKLGTLDNQIKLSGKDMERYISTASMISCEYCCGTDSIITKDGNAACGCQHSFAMRGLAKYLIKNHGTEFTNDQILEELGKWKTLFFPSEITKKAVILQGKGIELNYINLASNKYRNIVN